MIGSTISWNMMFFNSFNCFDGISKVVEKQLYGHPMNLTHCKSKVQSRFIFIFFSGFDSEQREMVSDFYFVLFLMLIQNTQKYFHICWSEEWICVASDTSSAFFLAENHVFISCERV